MNLEALSLFRDAAHRLSFAAVANDRGINPTSVSRAIGQLERELGVRLFHRSTRRMTLTDVGATFLKRADVVLSEMDEAREEVRSDTAGPVGRLRMTASTTFGERVIMPLMSQFRAMYPNLKLEMVFTDANLDFIADGIDLGIRLGAELKGDLVATKLFDTRYRVCVAPASLAEKQPLNGPSDLAAHSCLVFTLAEFRSSWLFRALDGSEIRVPISGDFAASSALSLHSAALSGLGPALLPDWLIANDLSAGRLVDLFPAHQVTATTFGTAAWLLYPSKSYLPHKVRVMIDFLKNHLRVRTDPRLGPK